MNSEIKTLASYVTYRQLYNDGKHDIYYVVSKFAESTIITNKLYTFNIAEISELINSQFGFSIPDYVIQSSLKRLDYVIKKEKMYTVDNTALSKKDDMVTESMENAAKINEKLASDLISFVEEKKGILSLDSQKKLKQEFCSFMLDDSTTNDFTELISAFILKNEDDVSFKSHLSQIKEGAVLFAGLNYNSNVSDKSAWKDEIVIYVENEILFHLAGYNGIVFQKLAEELFSLIDEMNMKSKKKVIHIRYFKEVSSEIETFFRCAEEIVEAKSMVSIDNIAMTEIVKGCHVASDVIEKKEKFYSLLNSKSIQLEKDTNFYADEYHEFNLESSDAMVKYQITDEKQRYIKHLNYVNILRMNKNEQDLKKSKYIVLTETGKMLKMAYEFCDDNKLTPLAINMFVLTNRLWFDLNKGFGANEFPTTFDVLVKSKIVLSKILTQNIAEKYEIEKEKYTKKEIDETKMANIVLYLREESKKPEEIEKYVVEDILSFISEEDVANYQSEKQLLSIKLRDSEKEKRSLYETISRQESMLDEYQNKFQKQDSYIHQKEIDTINEQIRITREQLIDYYQRKKNADKKIAFLLKIVKYILITVTIFYYLGVLLLFLKGNETVKLTLPFLLSLLPPGFSIILSFFSEKKLDFWTIYKRVLSFFENRLKKRIYCEYSIEEERKLILEMRMSDLEQKLNNINECNIKTN